MSGRVILHVVHDAGFDPSEARDPRGEWTGGGTAGSGSYKPAYSDERRGSYDPAFFDKERIDADAGLWVERLHPKPNLVDRVPAKASPGLIYRGMSNEEFEAFRKSGQIKSAGGYNIGQQQQGLTYYATDPATAESYANGFAPAKFKPSPGRPAYVVGVQRPAPEHIRPVEGTGTDEVGVTRPILANEVRSIHRGTPVEYDPGTPGSVSPSAWLHWEALPIPGAPKGAGGETFVSPNVHELPSMTSAHAMATAQAQIESRRHKLFQAAAEDIDLTLGITNKAEKSAVGAWKDGAEGTTVMIAPGATPEQLKLSAAMKGWLGQQKAVLSFAAKPDGKGMLYSALARGSLDDIHRALLGKGLENHTLVPTEGGATIYIADTDGSLAEDVAKYARAFGAKFKATPGEAEFIGATNYEGTTDAQQRAEGRQAYEALIAAAGDRVGAADWRRLRDRWASALETTHDRAVVRRTIRQAELSGQHAPAIGSTFYVFRAGSDAERQVEDRDAGNALGVAQHLSMLDDRTSSKPATLLGGGPSCVHVYRIRLHERIGPYQAIVGGTTPGLGAVGVGYRTKAGAAAISFGPNGAGYDARHVLSFPLREVRIELKRATGSDSFCEHGWASVADAIHAVAARHAGTQDRQRVVHVHVGDQEVFVEAQHPRQIGSHFPGRFAPKGTGGQPSGVHITTPHPGLQTRITVHPPTPVGRPALTGSKGHAATISSAFISAKTSPTKSNETYTQAGLPAMKSEPESFKAAMHLLKSREMYPYFRGLHGSADEIAEQVIGQMVSNLKFLAACAPPQTRKWGTAWYGEENKKARQVAAESGLPLQSVAGAYAALSPQNDWNMNVYQGDVVIDAELHQQRTPWSKAMDAKADEIGRTPRTRKLFAQVRGKSLGELTDPVEKAAWIRVWNEATSDRYHRLFRPDGQQGDWARKNDGGKMPATWKTLGAIANAIKSVESGGDRDVISAAMGGANKVRSFYNNILDPESANGDITVDTHAIGAALFDAIGGSSAPVMHGLGMSPGAADKPPGWKAAPAPARTGVAGLYGLHAEAYRRAARDLGMRPLELQSLTWEAKRALFEHMPAGAKSKITGIWKAYHDGEGSLDDARKAVVKAAGGMKEPDWVRAARDG
jgi:hypothetical protein